MIASPASAENEGAQVAVGYALVSLTFASTNYMLFLLSFDLTILI
jgi:hypothetical protein